MDRPNKLKALSNSLTGRMVLGVLLIHALLAPLLFGGVLYIVKQGYQAQFINQVRTESHLFAAIIERDLDDPQLNSQISDILLGGTLVFAQIVASDGSLRYSSGNPLAKDDFREDFFFGQHGDSIYYIALPLYKNPGDSPATVRLGYDEEPTQDQIRVTYQRMIFLALVYILLTIALVVFSGIQITDSLRRLRNATRKVALGNHAVQLDIDTNISEVTSLGKDLERMRWQLVRQGELLEYQASHDALTGLPNRSLVSDRIQQALAIGLRNHTSIALCIMDLDRFKEVNDTLGHHIGDLVLQRLALRMREALRDSDTVARLGGDEFAILMPTVEDAEHTALAAKKLLKVLSEPLLLEGHNITIGGSIGIALFPEHGKDKETLMRRADMAMYFAKRTQSGYAIYQHNLEQ